MENKYTPLEQFHINIEEHSSILEEIESHQLLDFNIENISIQFNDLIHRIVQIEPRYIAKAFENLLVILNRLKIYQFTSLFNIIDLRSSGLSLHFIIEAKSNRDMESKFFLNRLNKLNNENKLELVFNPLKINMVKQLLDDDDENCVLDKVDETFLLSLLSKLLTKDENNEEIKFNPPEYRLVTPSAEKIRIAYLKRVISNFNQIV